MEDAVAELMAAPLEEFVARRKALAARLREAGDREGARRLLAIRKPSTVLWAANQAARDQGASRALQAAAAELEASQAGALAGAADAGDRFRAASAAFQQALDRAALAGLRAHRSGEADGLLRRRLREVLQAAALGAPEARAALAAGSLTEEPEPPGFGGLAGVVPAPRAVAPTAVSAGRPALQVVRAPAAEAGRTREVAAAEGRARRAEADAADAERAAARAEVRAASGEEEARRLRQEAARARAHAEELREQAVAAAASLRALRGEG
jgi:hypothetical protein